MPHSSTRKYSLRRRNALFLADSDFDRTNSMAESIEDDSFHDVPKYSLRHKRGGNNSKLEEVRDDKNDENGSQQTDVEENTEENASENEDVQSEDEEADKRSNLSTIRLKKRKYPLRKTRTSFNTTRFERSQISSSSESEEENKRENRTRFGLRRSSLSVGRRRYPLRMRKRRRYNSYDERQTSNGSEVKPLENSPVRKRYLLKFNDKYRATHNAGMSSTSSSNDEKTFEKRKAKSMAKARSRCLPMNFKPEDLNMNKSCIKDRSRLGSSLADVDPMEIDKSTTFDSIGGLDEHVKSLKEMIVFPLLYPEVFQKFDITPPRGVLFYGHPGTGKTLVARALANECSQDDKKVSFFMRKGADCLSKWVGESERQLRLLFDQAYKMRPSIIFFDEIDGLAPVRSSRQDQIHSSIVSTLLALMDGLDSRGEMIIIGATNRPDAIDPALRRPGRFDREFLFPLPDAKARKQILEIHTKNWTPMPKKSLMSFLSEQTVGYCGADLRALCTEASLNALRMCYPQIYLSKQKLLLDVSQVQIKRIHFRQALQKIVPAGQRSNRSAARKLNPVIEPLLKPPLNNILTLLRESFPHGFDNKTLRNVHRPRILICGSTGQGQTTHLGPAVLHALEKVPMHKLDFPALYSVSSRTPEEACAQIFQEAFRSTPSIIYIPCIDGLWDSINESIRACFLSLLAQADPTTPVLMISTSQVHYNCLSIDLQEIFSCNRNECLTLYNPNKECRRLFFTPLFNKILQPVKVNAKTKRALSPLPLAPPPEPKKLTPEELKEIELEEEETLRELRIFLREICSKLAKNRLFYIFTRPVDPEEAPDYADVIARPMDLEKVMVNIDRHEYTCAQDFLIEIDLICSNALEYNPNRCPEDTVIRHRACALRDVAHAYIKAEMDSDFESKCQNIRKSRHVRSQTSTDLLPNFIHIHPLNNDNKVPKKISIFDTSHISQFESKRKSMKLHRRRCRSRWSRGLIIKRPKPKESPTKDKSKESPTEKVASPEEKAEFRIKIEGALAGSTPGPMTNGVADSDSNEGVHVQRLINGCPEDSKCTCSTKSLRKVSKLCDSCVALASDSKVEPEKSVDSNRRGSKRKRRLNLNFSGSPGILKIKDSPNKTHGGSPFNSPEISKNKTPKSSNNSSNSKLLNKLSKNSVSTAKTTCSPKTKTENLTESASDIMIDKKHYQAVLESCLHVTENCTVDDLFHLYSVLSNVVKKYAKDRHRNPVLCDIESDLRKFVQSQKNS